MTRTQIVIGVAITLLGWYSMMVVHEAGHCLGAIATGANIDSVKIPILGFSRTDVSSSSLPLLVVWAGPVFGSTAPLLLLVLLRFVGCRLKHTLLFFVGFCLIANGGYVGAGALIQAGDCADLLRYGSPLWLLVGFGVVALISGLFAWHQLGPFREWFAANPSDAPRTDVASSGGREHLSPPK